MTTGGPSRAQRLFAGWSANLVQMMLGIAQQVLLIPVFLHFWTSDLLAAWLGIYAAGNLVLIADFGLQIRAINRFLAFKSSLDCDGRTGRFYAAMLRTYFGFAGLLGLLLLVGAQLLPPSRILGFGTIPHFDAAFLLMTVGTLLMLPSNLVSALYRARGNYARVVWFQNVAMLVTLPAQIVAVVAGGDPLAVTVAYVASELLLLCYLLIVDAPQLFPFLRTSRGRASLSWSVGQFRVAFPFAVSGATEIALVNVPVLLVSALVSDRVAVAQWGLTRVVAGLVRILCVQATLPLAAELGHEYAIGQQQQVRDLYARGSFFVTLLASLIVSGLLPFWSDFFALWTHGNIPYDPLLTITLLIGTTLAAPSILALGFANYSNRGDLLVRTKGLQFAVFLVLSVALIPSLGPLGAAIAMVASDLLVQFGLLTFIIIGQTLQRPFRHVAFLTAVAALTVFAGWGAGVMIGLLVPWTGALHFVVECMLWLAAVAFAASPLANAGFRGRLIASIPS